MATTISAQGTLDPPHIRHHISDKHDFLLVVKVLGASTERDTERPVIAIHEFEVAKSALEIVDYFGVALNSNTFADTGKGSYELKEDDPNALKIWMQLLHGSLDTSSYQVDIATVWQVLIVARKYDFDVLETEARGWFTRWYNIHASRFSVADCRELLYPCYSFNEARSFAAVTKRLVYNVAGHIEERRPEGIPASQREHRITNNRIIGSLNAARGSLRTKLISRLYGPSRDLLNRGVCDMKKEVFWSYNEALEHTGAWPVEIEGGRKSITDLLDLLGDFEYKDPHAKLTCSPFAVCMRDFGVVVKTARTDCRDNFDGLCLDCMNCSVSADEDDEYWTHAASRSFDSNCRISHDQPTWYFSFLGRKEKMDLFQKKNRSKSKSS